MIDRIFKLFTKDTDTSDEILDYKKPDDIIITHEEVDVPEINYASGKIDISKPTILIMDDFEFMARLVYEELERVDVIDVYKNFNVITASSEYAGFSVKKALEEGVKFDVCFLDITLGGVIDSVEYDGVDIAIMIKEKYPNSNIQFITGHTLNRKNPEIFQFIQRFETHFDVPIDEEYDIVIDGVNDTCFKHIIPKNSNRVLLMGNAIKHWLSERRDEYNI
jgi:hypothetical protein